MKKRVENRERLRVVVVSSQLASTSSLATKLNGNRYDLRYIPPILQHLHHFIQQDAADAIIIDNSSMETQQVYQQMRAKANTQRMPVIVINDDDTMSFPRFSDDLYLHRHRDDLESQLLQHIHTFNLNSPVVAPSENGSSSVPESEPILEYLLHDLKTPLSVMYGAVFMLQEDCDIDTPAAKENVQSILNAVEEMKNLIADGLAVSRPPTFELSPFCLFVGNCVETLRPVATAEDVDLTLNAPDSDTDIQLDHGTLWRAVSNIITNAIQYTPPGGQVNVRAWLTDDKAILEVADTGIGIAEEALPEVFTRRYRSARSRAHHHDGSGLGLAIAKAMIEQHDGTITVDSQVDEGTTVRITLPQQQPAP